MGAPAGGDLQHNFSYGLENTIVANFQCAILDRFGEFERLNWIVTGFPLGSVAVTLPFGFAYGSFDNKWVYIMSIIIFEIGSASCGGAPNMNTLIVGRTIAGIGYYFPFYMVGGTLIVIGGVLMHTVDETTSTSGIYGFSVLIGLGSGHIMQVASSIGPAKVIPVWEDVPAVIGFINVSQIGGVVHSLDISGAIFQNYAFRDVSAAVKDFDLSAQQIRAVIAGTNSAVIDTMTLEQKSLAIGGVGYTMQKFYILIATAGALCIICGVLMRREKLFMEGSAGGA